MKNIHKKISKFLSAIQQMGGCSSIHIEIYLNIVPYGRVLDIVIALGQNTFPFLFCRTDELKGEFKRGVLRWQMPGQAINIGRVRKQKYYLLNINAIPFSMEGE